MVLGCGQWLGSWEWMRLSRTPRSRRKLSECGRKDRAPGWTQRCDVSPVSKAMGWNETSLEEFIDKEEKMSENQHHSLIFLCSFFLYTLVYHIFSYRILHFLLHLRKWPQVFMTPPTSHCSGTLFWPHCFPLPVALKWFLRPTFPLAFLFFWVLRSFPYRLTFHLFSAYLSKQTWSPDSRDHVFFHIVFPTQPDGSSVFCMLAAPTAWDWPYSPSEEWSRKVNNSKEFVSVRVPWANLKMPACNVFVAGMFYFFLEEKKNLIYKNIHKTSAEFL